MFDKGNVQAAVKHLEKEIGISDEQLEEVLEDYVRIKVDNCTLDLAKVEEETEELEKDLEKLEELIDKFHYRDRARGYYGSDQDKTPGEIISIIENRFSDTENKIKEAEDNLKAAENIVNDFSNIQGITRFQSRIEKEEEEIRELENNFKQAEEEFKELEKAHQKEREKATASGP